MLTENVRFFFTDLRQVKLAATLISKHWQRIILSNLCLLLFRLVFIRAIANIFFTFCLVDDIWSCQIALSCRAVFPLGVDLHLLLAKFGDYLESAYLEKV